MCAHALYVCAYAHVKCVRVCTCRERFAHERGLFRQLISMAYLSGNAFQRMP